MRELVKILGGLSLFCFLFGCFNKINELKDKDFIGKWSANDGGFFELKSDGRFIGKGINMNNIFFSDFGHERKEDIIGRWHFDSKKKEIEINSSDYQFSFKIIGQGPLGNKSPWDLYVYVGDPDEMNRYLFSKVSRQ